jgi:hypothetical protein
MKPGNAGGAKGADCPGLFGGLLNPVLRGWAQYFRRGNASRQFAAVDRYVTFRLARFDQDKRARDSLGWTKPELLEQFRNTGVYRLTGTVRYSPGAHATP